MNSNLIHSGEANFATRRNVIRVCAAMAAAVAIAGCASAPQEAASGDSAGPYKPAKWNLEAREKFAAQRFGIFIHWGLYADYAQGEWYQQQIGMDTETYGRIKDGFYPSKFDAKEWVRVYVSVSMPICCWYHSPCA